MIKIYSFINPSQKTSWEVMQLVEDGIIPFFFIPPFVVILFDEIVIMWLILWLNWAFAVYW